MGISSKACHHVPKVSFSLFKNIMKRCKENVFWVADTKHIWGKMTISGYCAHCTASTVKQQIYIQLAKITDQKKHRSNLINCNRATNFWTVICLAFNAYPYIVMSMWLFFIHFFFSFRAYLFGTAIITSMFYFCINIDALLE